MPFLQYFAAMSAVAVPSAGYYYYQHWVPSKVITTEDPVTKGTAVPMLRAAAFLDAHGSEWEVQKSNITNTIEGQSKKPVVELEILKIKPFFVVQQPSDVYAAYNADETAGDKRLFFSAVPHDSEKVTTNVPAMRLAAYVPHTSPKQIAQHIVHVVLRRRWDKNYMAYDKAFIDEAIQHPDLFSGIKEVEVPCGDKKAVAETIKKLSELDAKQLAYNETTPLMVIPPNLRSSITHDGSTQPLGLRRGFEPVHACWARHCVGSATLEKFKMRPREFLYEMLVGHKSIVKSEAGTNLASVADPVKASRWSRKLAQEPVAPATSILAADDAYSIVYQCLPQCLLPSSVVKLPPAPLDPFADANALMATRLRSAGSILSSLPPLPFRTAPVQMHYQEMLLVPVWTTEDKQQWIEYIRTAGGSIQQDMPVIKTPAADPATGIVPPSTGTFLIMTSCNDAQTPAAMPKWLMRSLAMTMASGAYNMLADGIRTYEEGK